jgi:hypothetical protein
VLSLNSFSQKIARGLRWASELHADHAVGAPQYGGIQDLHVSASPCQQRSEGLDLTLEPADGRPMRVALEGQGRRAPDEVPLGLAKVAEDLVDASAGDAIR